MPLLGKRIFHCVKPLTDLKDGEQVYTIPHTKERFRSKAEYDKRVDLYDQRIWQCQCTGHLSLTHEEAWNSEKAVKQSLSENFSECYEKSVLEIVHHNTVALECLVDQAWLKVQQVLCIGEKVCLKIKKGGQLIKGSVVGIDTTGVEANPTSNCSSPSSDKENTTSAETNDTGSPKKWVPPKLLPYKYNVNLTEEDKIINGIPAAELTRIDRPPSKEFVRLFIRSSALRYGTTNTSPWVVNDDLVTKYHLPSKFADFLLSPARMAEAAKRAEEEVSKKRKLVKKSSTGSAKKLKMEKGEEKKPKKRKLKDGDAKPRKNGASPAKKPKLFKSPKKDKPKSGDSATKSDSPKKKKVKPSMVITIDSESSDDEIVLANLKKKTSAGDDSDSDVPLANLTNHTPKKASPKKVKVKKDKDTPKSKGAKSPGKKSKEQKTKSPVKKKVKAADDGMPKKRGRPKKDPAEKEKSKKTPGQKSPKKVGKGMKQLTLLDMSKGKDPSMQEKTPRKSTGAAKSSSPGTPAIAKKLIKLKKADEKIKFGQLLKTAALTLTSAQRNNLPLEIRDLVQKKFEKIEERKLLEKMGPEEREAYMKVKREKMRIQQMETQRLKRKRFDERDLTLAALPAPKMVVTPDGLSNGAFGDVAMVTELISCYSGLLMPQDEYPIYADALMKALCGGTKGFTYLSRVLVVLLQTLLQDEIAEDYKELRVALADIPLNAYTASEMVRLCLRRQDHDDDHSNDVDLEDHDVPDAVIQQLTDREFYQLSPQDKLQVLKALCLRVLGTYSVQDYMEEKQKEATALIKQKVAEQKEMNEKLKEKKELLKEKKEELKQVKEQAKSDSDSAKASPAPATGTEINGKGDEKGNGEEKPNEGTDPMEADEDNLVATVRRRRVLAAKAAAEKERLEKERKIQREKEFEEERLRRDKENFDKMYKEGIILAKMVLRQTPLGTDRDHSRYWIFTNTTPGLFVEKGWVTKDMEYSVEPSSPIKLEDSIPSLPSTPAKQGSQTPLPATPAKRGRKRKGDWANSSDVNDEELFGIPEAGPNQWYVYESAKDLDTLVEALHPQGFRESLLRAEIKKHYDLVSKSMLNAQRTNNELRDSDGDTEMMASLKKEMVEMELRLRNGGLGGVPDYDKWEAKVLAAEDLKSLGPCLVQMQGSILEKFLQGSMKPIAKKTQEKANDVKEEPETKEDDEEEEEEEEVVKKDARTQAIEAWKEAVQNCKTVSRLHVLVGMLDSCVKWEKSAENAKCKICRKKCDDDRLLLCDECNQAFHMYCLRPQLLAVPRGDWFCPACVPMNRRRCIDTGRNYKEASTDDDDDEEKEEQEENCQECGGDEGLIFCSKCPAAYHPECHDPPLRHPPRGRWVCTTCKTGGGRKTRSARQSSRASRSRRPPPKKRYVSEDEEESEDEDEEEEEEVSDEEEAEEVREAVQRSTRETSRQNRSGRSSRSSNSPRSSAREEVVENYGPSRTSKRPPSELSICENILARLVKHKNSWPFLEPVDKREVPDYHVIIRHPMDFQTIRQKLGRLSYSSAQEFVQDVNLVFRNAEEYNKRDSDVYLCMVELEKFFMEQLSKQLPYSASSMAAYNGFADTSSSRRRLRR